MATPQFSLRRMLVLVTLAGVLCIIPAMASSDLLWLAAPLVAVAAGVVLALVGAGMFMLVGIAAGVVARQRKTLGEPREQS